MSSAPPLSPTFYGHIASTQDALLLFEACLNGSLSHVARRPHDRERSSLIKSGNVFIYEEHSSGIKRWTDGVPWSPSRILGNFLVYRELERPFLPGEKKRAMKRSKRSPGISKAAEPFGTASASMNSYVAASASSYLDSSSSNSLSKETERSLVGSLVDSYGFKEEGLVKKTVSVTVGGVSHHLVSYYTVADVMNNKFTTPSKDSRFQHTLPRADLITKQNFRTPIDEVDSMDPQDRSIYNAYPGTFPRNGYEMTNQTLSNRSMSLPTPPVSYSSSSMYGNYGMQSSIEYEGLPTTTTTTTNSMSYSSQFAPSPGIYPAKVEPYDPVGYSRQRHNSVIGMSSEPFRGQVPPAVTTNFQRRGSIYDHSAESGLSSISTTSADSNISSDSGYASSYYNNYRDSNTTHQNYAVQRSLPTPIQPTTFDRAHTYHVTESPVSTKENFWPLGNSGGGHGHYIAPQQQWASTGAA